VKNWKGWLAGASILLAMMSLAVITKQSVVTFHHLKDAHARFSAAGFFCTSDRSNGRVGSGFLISRERVSWNEAGTLKKTGNMGPEWKGKVWVTFSPSYWQLETIPNHAGTRSWGDVVAFGDQELLSELDSVLASSFDVL
jgi:hypothetical protein